MVDHDTSTINKKAILSFSELLGFRLTPRTHLSDTEAVKGADFTTLKDRKKEIGRDLLAKMCRDLKIDPEVTYVHIDVSRKIHGL